MEKDCEVLQYMKELKTYETANDIISADDGDKQGILNIIIQMVTRAVKKLLDAILRLSKKLMSSMSNNLKTEPKTESTETNPSDELLDIVSGL